MKRIYSKWLCMNAKENSLSNATHTETMIMNISLQSSSQIYNVFVIGLTKRTSSKEEEASPHHFLTTLLSDKRSVGEDGLFGGIWHSYGKKHRKEGNMLILVILFVKKAKLLVLQRN